MNENTEAAEEWIDEYEKFRATEADEWVKELTSAANVQKVFILNGLYVEIFAILICLSFCGKPGNQPGIIHMSYTVLLKA